MLRNSDAIYLYDSGFTWKEIHYFRTALTPDGRRQPLIDLDGNVWQLAINTRFRKVENIKEGYFKAHGENISRSWLSKILNEWYVDNPNSNPFDWLKREYRRIKSMTGKQLKEAVQRLKTFPTTKKFI